MATGPQSDVKQLDLPGDSRRNWPLPPQMHISVYKLQAAIINGSRISSSKDICRGAKLSLASWLSCALMMAI
jgi:hypothetical protein